MCKVNALPLAPPLRPLLLFFICNCELVPFSYLKGKAIKKIRNRRNNPGQASWPPILHLACSHSSCQPLLRAASLPRELGLLGSLWAPGSAPLVSTLQNGEFCCMAGSSLRKAQPIWRTYLTLSSSGGHAQGSHFDHFHACQTAGISRCLSANLPTALPPVGMGNVETIEAECNQCLQKKLVQDLFIGR